MSHRYQHVDLEEQKPRSPSNGPDERPAVEGRGVRRQRNLLAVAVVVLLAVIGAQTTARRAPRSPSRLSPYTSSRVHSFDDNSPSARYRWVAQGQWMPPNNSVWTEDDVRKRWGMGVAGNLGGGRRRLEVASSWRWQPDGGASLAQWDSWRFLLEMYNSEKGLLILGDSVSNQMFEVIRGMLNLPSGAYKASSFYQKDVGEPPYVGLFATEPTISLLRRALPDVPTERFHHPFVSRLRHDTLVSRDELRSFAEKVNVRNNLRYEGWLRSDPWEQELPQEGRKTWRGERNSVLLLNTGAHWSEGALGQDEQGLVDLTRETARSVLARLASVPALDVVYRATAPGHPYCDNSSTPIYSALPFEDHESHPEWSWSTFGKLNKAWAEELDRIPWMQPGQLVYLDITEMSGQRPDAHTGDRDCLHWALPGVIGVWVEELWTIMTDSA